MSPNQFKWFCVFWERILTHVHHWRRRICHSLHKWSCHQNSNGYSCMTMVQYRIFQRASNYFVFCYVFRPWFWHDFKQLVFTVHSVFQEHFVTRPTDSGQLGCWVHGKLGKKYRRPIPSCAVKEIRKAFPSESGEYKGFEYARHDM